MSLDPPYKSADAVVTAVREIPSPYVPPDVLGQLLENMNSQIDQINALLRLDYATIIRIFAVANSVLHGNEEEVVKVNDAITNLGHGEIEKILDDARGEASFPNLPRKLFSLTAFWNHCVTVAVSAETIARFLHEKDTERFFLCGLLHDIGRLLMLTAMPRLYAISMLEGRYKVRSLQSQELRIFGYDHTEVGVEAIRYWNLPSFLEEPIEHHHSPTDSHQQVSLTVVTHLADAMAHALHLGQSGEIMMPKIYSHQIQELGIQPAHLHELAVETVTAVSPLLIRNYSSIDENQVR